MTTLLFTEDLHRQHLDVGQLRFWTALPQPTAERHHPVAIIDEQIQQDQRFFQTYGRLPKPPWTNLRRASPAPKTRESGLSIGTIL